jgi:carbon storage regulator
MLRRRHMLVLTRKIGEEIIIDEEICITIVDIRGDRVRLGITAPKATRVDRREIYERRRGPCPGKEAE